MNELASKFTLQSYIEKNRKSLDESLVSLRLMKEIDRFLDLKQLSNKDLAVKLGYSESYISQLMSGVKNINVSFISKFEKTFDTRLDFNLYLKETGRFLKKRNNPIQINIKIEYNIPVRIHKNSILSSSQNSNSTFCINKLVDEIL